MLAAAEAEQIGYGGVSLLSRACGLSRVTIIKGIQELSAPALPAERVRRSGGGRHSLIQHDPKLPDLLESLVADRVLTVGQLSGQGARAFAGPAQR